MENITGRIIKRKIRGNIMVKPQTLQQSQLLSNIAKETGLPIATVRKVLDHYEKEAKNEIMNGKKVPLPGAMGYISLALTTSKTRKAYLDLTACEVTIEPKLRTVAGFSKPWREFIKYDIRAAGLIKELVNKKKDEE